MHSSTTHHLAQQIRSPPNGAVLNQDTGTFTFDMPFPSGTAVTFYMWDDAAGSGGAIGPCEHARLRRPTLEQFI